MSTVTYIETTHNYILCGKRVDIHINIARSLNDIYNKSLKMQQNNLLDMYFTD